MNAPTPSADGVTAKDFVKGVGALKDHGAPFCFRRPYHHR